MSIININLTQIEQSTITVLHPFIYDTKKIKLLDIDNLLKLKCDYLEDFLPYTKNFFGNYHFSKDTPTSVQTPCILQSKDIFSIDFYKEKKITEVIKIENIVLYLFEKSIGILTINYKMPKNISNEQYLLYHWKLSTLKKNRDQNIKTSHGKEFKYYFEFIDDLLSSYCHENSNIFDRSYLYTYNLLTSNQSEQASSYQNFIEPLIQYRKKLDDTSVNLSNTNYIQQTANIYTIANENVLVHIGIKLQGQDNNFIDNEFFNKYQNNHFLTYIITLYQTSKMEQLIIKAFLKEDNDKDLKNMQDIKNKILHFIANGNFTKISNNSIRNNLYKFYRENFEIQDLIKEIDTVSNKISNKLETLLDEAQSKRDETRNLFIGIIGLFIGIIGVILAIIQIYQAM